MTRGTPIDPLRRNVLRVGVAAGMAALLAGCGFKMRGVSQLPFKSIYLTFAQNSELGANLKRNIRYTSTTEVVDTPQQAQAIFQVLGENRVKNVVTLDSQGRVRDYELLYYFNFRVHDGRGREFIAPTQMVQRRELAFSDSALMAKEQEENLLYREMQSDLVQQLMRRLEAADATPR